MTLLIVRHGETDLNAARVLQPPDTPLNGRGLAQAAAVAGRLVAWRPWAVLSSDQPRAVQTAEVIASAVGAPLVFSPLLRERHFGEWRGRHYDELPGRVLDVDAAPPGGESLAAFDARVALAWAELLALQAGRTELPLSTPPVTAEARFEPAGRPLVVVTHGLVIRRLLQRHLPLPVAQAAVHLGNTALTAVEAAPPHRLRLLACTRHLDGPGAAADDPLALSGG